MARQKRASKRKAVPAKASPRRSPWRRQLAWLVTGPVGILLLLVALGWYTSLDVDDISRPRPSAGRPQITLLDHEGVAFASFGDRYGDHLTLEQMSPWLPKAVVAIEDRRFYHHPGIDPIGIGRALIRNIQAGRVVQGGSTISQQLAKLAFLTPERSLSRKIKEALYTIWIEARLGKNEILEAYLNRVYLGSGSFGVDAAARRYFRKPAKDLSLPQSAMLAGLIKAPSHYAPTRDLDLARTRAAVVLGSMVESGMITAELAASAKAAPATLAEPETRSATGYFADWAVAESRLYAGDEQSRLEVRTTLDRDLQAAAEAAVRTAFAEHAESREVEQAALVAMTPDGQVRAMLGGRAYEASQFNRATQAERQPGSAFKLFVFLAALEAGWRPEDMISGAPVEVDGWQPRNFDDRYPAELRLVDAFADSVNTAAVRLSEEVGRDAVVDLAERLGIISEMHDHPSLALGSSEVRLLDLTAAYATVANGGRLVWPEGIEAIRGAKKDKVLYRRREIDEPVLAPATVRAMSAMLQTALVRGTGWRASLRRFAAGKTGTSSDHRDAVFVGFTDELVVGVWVGNDDGRPMKRVTGGGLPALIFRDFILRAQGDLPFLPPPPPPKPRDDEPLVAVREAIGDLVGGVVRSIRGLFGG